MAGRQHHHEILVVERPGRQPLQIDRQRQQRDIEFVVAQLFEQHAGEVLLDHQRHQRCGLAHQRHQRREHIRTDGVDGAEPQAADQLILAFAGDVLDALGFGKHLARLLDDPRADRGRLGFATDAFEQGDAEFVLQLLQRHRQRRLGHERTLRGAREMALLVEVHEVAEFGQRHGRPAWVGWLGIPRGYPLDGRSLDLRYRQPFNYRFSQSRGRRKSARNAASGLPGSG